MITARTGVLTAACLLVPAVALAQDVNSTHARSAALADATTAGTDPTVAIARNPAGLGELDGTVVGVSTQAATSRLWSAQTDRQRQRFEQDIVGFGLTVATRLPGPPLLQRLRVGIDVYTPPTHLIRLEAPARVDEPTWPLYGQRLDHLKATVSAGIAVTDGLSIGAGIMVRPLLTANTYVSYEPGRSDSTAQNVVVNADRSLALGSAALIGVRAKLTPKVAVAASYRQGQGGKIEGETSVAAGSVLIRDELDFYQTWNPAEVTFGAELGRLGPATVSADLVWARWSDYRTIRNDVAEPGFSDVLNARVGLQWSLSEATNLRAGYGFEPSPVPAQVGDSNLLDGRRHVAALGAGFDFAALGIAPVRLDLHVRGHFLETQRSAKEEAQLTDADPDVDGQQIENLGYPGLEAGGQFWQTGIALVFGGGRDE